MSFNFISPEVNIWRQKFTNFNHGWGSAPDPSGGAYDAPPNLLDGWRGGYLPRPLPLDTFGVSISATSAPRTSHHRPPNWLHNQIPPWLCCIL